MLGIGSFDLLRKKYIESKPSGRPRGTVSDASKNPSASVKISVKVLDEAYSDNELFDKAIAEKKELKNKIALFARDFDDEIDDFVDSKRDLFNKTELGVERGNEAAEQYKNIVEKWASLVARFEDDNEETPEILIEMEDCRAILEKLESDIIGWKKNKQERDKFLGKNENKGWESIFKEAKSKIIYPAKTKDEFLAENPTIKLDDSFGFDLGEKLDAYLQQSDEHVDAFHDDEKKLFRKVLKAATAISSTDLPMSSVVLDGLTYGIIESTVGKTKKSANKKAVAASSVKIETDEEKEERTKLSRVGAQITLQRINNFKELDALDPTETGANTGDNIFLEKTRELWKEFAVHGRLGDKDPVTGEPVVIAYSDTDGKVCIELLKQAGIDTSDLKFVTPGSFEEGRINMDTGGKHGVIVEDFNKSGEKTAFIDHHGEESSANSSATEIMYKMLVDLGLLEKSNGLDKLVEFVTNVDSGTYLEVEKYLENSWKTVYGMERWFPNGKLVEFFKENKNPDPTRELTKDEMWKYGLIYYTDKTKKVIENKSEKQEKVAKKSKERLEQMDKDGFIIPSIRYGKIVVNLESGIAHDKNVPGGFLAGRAYGCDTFITWNPKARKFNISARVPITEEYPQGLRVREIMWVKNDGDGDELKVTLGEILEKMTDGKMKPTGKLKEFLEQEAISKIEPVGSSVEKEKTLEELYESAKEESFGILSVELFQGWLNGCRELAVQNNTGEDDVKKLMKIEVEKALNKNTKKEGKELEKVIQYILEKLK